MPALPPRQTRSVLAAAAAAAFLAGCGSMQDVSRSVADVITPYKVEVVQGNFISKEQVQALQPGMSREQVRQILGTPLVSSLFHGDRWDYVFTIRRKGVEAQRRQLACGSRKTAWTAWKATPCPARPSSCPRWTPAAGQQPRLEATEEEMRALPPGGPATPAQRRAGAGAQHRQLSAARTASR